MQSQFTLTAAFAWVKSGLGTNVFLASTSTRDSPFFVRFHTGQRLSFFFALVCSITPFLGVVGSGPVLAGTRYALFIALSI